MVKENQKVVRYTLKEKNNDLRDIHFDVNINEKTIEFTYDHPLYVVDKGYCSYSPEQTKKILGHIVGQIEVGDFLKYHGSDDKILVTNIEELDETKTVYNLDDVEDNHNFLANGVLHTIGGPPPGLLLFSGFTCFSENVVVTLPNGDLKK